MLSREEVARTRAVSNKSSCESKSSKSYLTMRTISGIYIDDVNKSLQSSDIYPDECGYATVVPLLMRGGGNVDSTPSKHHDKVKNSSVSSNTYINSINIHASNNNNINNSINFSKKSNKHNDSKSRKSNSRMESNDGMDSSVNEIPASAPVTRKNSALSFFTRSSKKHHKRDVNKTPEIENNKLVASTSAATTTSTQSSLTPLISQPLTRKTSSLFSSKNKNKQVDPTTTTTTTTTTTITVSNTSIGLNNNSISNNDSGNNNDTEEGSTSAAELAIASRPTLTIITDLDYEDEMDRCKSVQQVCSADNHERVSITNSPYMNSSKLNVGTHFPSATNSMLDLAGMAQRSHNHSRCSSSGEMANSTHHIGGPTSVTINNNDDYNNNNNNTNTIDNNDNCERLHLESNSATAYKSSLLSTINESDPLHSNNEMVITAATTEEGPQYNNNNNNSNSLNVNTILFHGVSASSSHSSNYNANTYDYPPKSTLSTSVSLTNVLNYQNPSYTDTPLQTYNNHHSDLTNTNDNNNNSSSSNINKNKEVRFSARLLEPGSTLTVSSAENESHFMSRCATMESIPETRSARHRLTATPVVPINAFVDHEARKRAAIEMQRRFGGTYNNNDSNEPKESTTAITTTTNNNNNNNNNDKSEESAGGAQQSAQSAREEFDKGIVVKNNNINNSSTSSSNNNSSTTTTTTQQPLLSNTESTSLTKAITNNESNNNSKKDNLEQSVKSAHKNDNQAKDLSKSYKSPFTLNMCPRNAGKTKDYKLHPSVVNAAAVRAEALRQAREKIVRIGAQRLQERLNELHLVTYRIKHDGNCQFRAIAQQLLGSEDYDDIIRNHVISYMKRVRAKCFDYYFESVKEADAYFNKLSKPGAWGDELTLRGASDSLYINIHVLSSQEKNCYILYRPSEDAPPPPTFLVDVAKIRQRRRAERARRRIQQQQQQQVELSANNNNNNNNRLTEAAAVGGNTLLNPFSAQASSMINSVSTSQANSMDINGYSNYNYNNFNNSHNSSANSLLSSFQHMPATWNDYTITTNSSNSKSNNNNSSRILLQRQESSPLLAQGLTASSSNNLFNNKNTSSINNNETAANINTTTVAAVSNEENTETDEWNDPDAEIDACEVQRALQEKLLHNSIIIPRQFAAQGSFSLAPTAPVTRIHTPTASFNEHEYNSIQPSLRFDLPNATSATSSFNAPFTYNDFHSQLMSNKQEQQQQQQQRQSHQRSTSYNLLRPLKDIEASEQETLEQTSKRGSNNNDNNNNNIDKINLRPIPYPPSLLPSQPQSNSSSQIIHTLDNTPHNNNNNTPHNNNSDYSNNNKQESSEKELPVEELARLPTDEPQAFVASPIVKNETLVFPLTSSEPTTNITSISTLDNKNHNAGNSTKSTICSTNALCSTLSKFTAAGAEVQCNPTISVNLVRHTEIPLSKLKKMKLSGLQINTNINAPAIQQQQQQQQQQHWFYSAASSFGSSTPYMNTSGSVDYSTGNSNSFPVFQTSQSNDIMLLASAKLNTNVLSPESCTSTVHPHENIHMLPDEANTRETTHVDENYKTHMEDEGTVFNLTPPEELLDEFSIKHTDLLNSTSASHQRVTSSLGEGEVNTNSFINNNTFNMNNTDSGDVCFVFEPRTEPIDVFISYLYPVHYNALVVMESSEAATAIAANESKLSEFTTTSRSIDNNVDNKNSNSNSNATDGYKLVNNSNNNNNSSNNKNDNINNKSPSDKSINNKNLSNVKETTTLTAATTNNSKQNLTDADKATSSNLTTSISADTNTTLSASNILQPTQSNQVIGASFLRLKSKPFVSLPNSFSQYELRFIN